MTAPVPPTPSHSLASTFNFRVTLTSSTEPGPVRSSDQTRQVEIAPAPPLGDAGFQECSGLEIEMDVQEYREGGRNDGTVRLVGRGRYTNVVLKRGMLFGDDGVRSEFWQWIQESLGTRHPIRRYNGVIDVLDNRGQRVLATWSFKRGLPAKVSGPQLNAKTGEVAIEELHIAHEGLRLELPDKPALE